MMDLATIWAGLLALAVFIYVALDGFDLGIGILFPFAKDRAERSQMMSAVAPVWDGNETWLVLGGGGLLATFPLAYAVLMPALYGPIILMLIGLIFRGVAFEFRHNAKGRWQSLWSVSFGAGSVVATLAQGFVLGGFIQGVAFENNAFAGGPWDWATPFTLIVALGLTAGYALLGAAWLVYKTEGPLHARAQKWTRLMAIVTGVALAVVSLATLYVDPRVTARWGLADGSLDGPDIVLGLLPLAAAGVLAAIHWAAPRSTGIGPYLLSLVVFACGYLGLAFSLWPYMVPFALTPQDAAAPDNALQFMLVGAVILLPMILAYTFYSYWVFRAKVAPDASYH
jgi:cytochrome d ubiquinol oxidase subunit II